MDSIGSWRGFRILPGSGIFWVSRQVLAIGLGVRHRFSSRLPGTHAHGRAVSAIPAFRPYVSPMVLTHGLCCDCLTSERAEVTEGTCSVRLPSMVMPGVSLRSTAGNRFGNRVPQCVSVVSLRESTHGKQRETINAWAWHSLCFDPQPCDSIRNQPERRYSWQAMRHAPQCPSRKPRPRHGERIEMWIGSVPRHPHRQENV